MTGENTTETTLTRSKHSNLWGTKSGVSFPFYSVEIMTRTKERNEKCRAFISDIIIGILKMDKYVTSHALL
jgi:hypothetical protein